MANLLTTISAEFTPLTQTNYLKAGVLDARQPEYVWTELASDDLETFPTKHGEPQIVSVRGLRAPNTTPNNVSNISDPNAGINFSGIQYEQFMMQVDRYDGGDFVDMFSRHFPIADKFFENYITLAQGAASSADFIARNVGYGVYTSMQSVVRLASGSASTTVEVDDIRGFKALTGAQGEVATANIVVGANTYVLSSAVANSSATSSFTTTDGTLSGIAGTLTFTSAVAAADLTSHSPVKAVGAPTILRANARVSTQTLAAGDTLNMALIQKGKNLLVNNRMVGKNTKQAVLYATPDALYGLYRDPEFQLLYRGAYGSKTYTTGEVADLLGIRIVEVTSAPIQTLGALTIHRPIMVAEGWITKYEMTSTMFDEQLDGPVHRIVADNIAMITTAPTDPAGQFVKQAYLQFVGYSCRTDRLLTSAVVPTATNAIYKRAVVFEVTAS
jgi:hypothetical protein